MIFDLDSIEKVMSILSSIFTVIGVIFAISSINTWKVEFVNTKLDLLIGELEDEFGKLFRSIAAYRDARIMVVKYETRTGASLDYDVLKKIESDKRDNYLKQRDIYSMAFEKLSRYYNLDSLQQSNSEVIAKKAALLYQEIKSIYNQEDLHQSDEHLINNESRLEEIWINSKAEFRDLRKKALLTKT
jgi:hypothetical protein